MNRLVLLSFLAAGLIPASTSTYHISFDQNSVINGQQIKPGHYKLQVNNNKAVLMEHGKQVAEAPANVETASRKFESTQVEYVNNTDVQEIDFGGTRTKVVFGQVTGAK